jgi:hypothetical protein
MTCPEECHVTGEYGFLLVELKISRLTSLIRRLIEYWIHLEVRNRYRAFGKAIKLMMRGQVLKFDGFARSGLVMASVVMA